MSFFSDSDKLYECWGKLLDVVTSVPGLSEIVGQEYKSDKLFEFTFSEPEVILILDLRHDPVSWHRGPSEEQPDIAMRMSADDGHLMWLNRLNILKAIVNKRFVTNVSLSEVAKVLPMLSIISQIYHDLLCELGYEALLQGT